MKRIITAALLSLAAVLPAAGGVVNSGQEAAGKAAEPVMAYLAKLVAIAPGAATPLFSAEDLAIGNAACVPDRKPRMHGLLIGAASPGPSAMILRGPENDVRLMATALAASGTAGSDVHSLVGDAANREGIRAATARILASLGCDDRVVIYFGGHSGTPDASIISDAVATARPEAGGVALQNALIYAEGAEAQAAARAIHWHRGSGLLLFLNGEGSLTTDPANGLMMPDSFEVFSAADLSQMVTAFRNRGADVAAILDTNFASEAALMRRQREAASIGWSTDISAAAPGAPAAASPFDALPLGADAGAFAVLYSSIGQSASIEASFGEGEERTTFGEFTFRISAALQNRQNLTVRGLADALRAVMTSSTEPSWNGEVRHRVEATDPEMPIFADADFRPAPSKAIRILRPTPKRGAMPVETPEVEIGGRVEWTSPARMVWVGGEKAELDAAGNFALTVPLRSGLNRVPVTAMTADWRTHEASLEFVFEGDKKALEGEGKRFAVVIANQNYGGRTGFASLQTPFADADALVEVLEKRFGFVTEAKLPDGRTVPLVLKDASARDIQTVLHAVNVASGENDTVLIYYAGHGIYESVTTMAFWVPVDAEAGVPFSYLSASAITEQLQRMVARKVLLISDSCYSGALTRGGPGLEALREEDRTQALLRLAEKRSRVLISSGGNEPVEDLGGGGHSVFARALITGLSEMDDEAFSSRELFDGYLLPMVIGRSDQEPQYRPIERSGHDGGDIVFVRKEPTPSAE